MKNRWIVIRSVAALSLLGAGLSLALTSTGEAAKPGASGACCRLDNTCIITTQSRCYGTWQGRDTVCTPGLCGDPNPFPPSGQ